MTMQRLAVALGGINLLLLLLVFSPAGPTTADTVPPILRSRAVELVVTRATRYGSRRVNPDS